MRNENLQLEAASLDGLRKTLKVQKSALEARERQLNKEVERRISNIQREKDKKLEEVSQGFINRTQSLLLESMRKCWNNYLAKTSGFKAP